jgi:exopolysaccharide biosynthesis polyprenyl glycosylphosphotransferase
MVSVLRPKKIITLLVDLGLMYGALFLALTLRHLEIPPQGRWMQGLIPFSIVFLFYILIFYISGLYTLQDLRSFARKLQKTFQAFFLATGMAFIVFYFMPDDSYSPKTILLLFAGIYFLIFLGWRHIANRLLGVAYPSLNVAFLGWAPILSEILADDELLRTFNLKVRGVYEGESSQRKADSSQAAADSFSRISSIGEMEALLENGEADLVVMKSGSDQEPEIRELLFRRLSRKAVYMSLPEFYEMTMARVPIDSINQMWFLEHLQFRDKIAYERIKRVGDFAAALLALLISLPLWPLIALIIKLSSRGPVFFSQIRSGLTGRPYTIIKFRTMTVAGNDYGITVEGDARITGVGKILRKTRLDELPQLINIIKGEMSFVGPRPERPELIEQLEKEVPFYRQRMLVMPGLTGWDQVSGEYHGATVEDTWKKLQYDLYYVKNRSLYLDFIIILKTIATVLSHTGR